MNKHRPSGHLTAAQLSTGRSPFAGTVTFARGSKTGRLYLVSITQDG